MKKTLAILTLLFFTNIALHAETSVWQVKSPNGSILYLGGTCHILRKDDYPLPKEFDQAYQLASVLVFETDMASMSKPETQQKILVKAMYADGSSLSKVLSPDVLKSLKTHCDKNGIPFESVNQMKPFMVSLMLLSVELQKIGAVGGVDFHYNQKASTDSKKIESLESLDEQIELLASMGEGNEDEFVQHSLQEIENTQTEFEKLIAAWKTGDEKEIDEQFIRELKTKYPELYKKLLVDRNNNWLPKIEAYLKTPEIEYVLVGLAHLIGEDGIIAQLKKRGYTIEKAKAE